jgi:hypothetical protein
MCTNRIVIAITMTIYISTGVVIWRKRRQLRKFSFSASHPGISMMSTRTTEVRVTREVLTSNSEEEGSVGPAGSAQDSGNVSHDEEKAEARGADSKRCYRPYTVTINAGPDSKLVSPPLPSSNSLAPPSLPPTVSRAAVASRPRETDDVAWSYARAALSYFIAMIVTWVRSYLSDFSKSFLFENLSPGLPCALLAFVISKRYSARGIERKKKGDGQYVEYFFLFTNSKRAFFFPLMLTFATPITGPLKHLSRAWPCAPGQQPVRAHAGYVHCTAVAGLLERAHLRHRVAGGVPRVLWFAVQRVAAPAGGARQLAPLAQAAARPELRELKRKTISTPPSPFWF